MTQDLHPKSGTDLTLISVRRRLDKGEQIKGSEVRMLCMMIDQLKARVTELEKDARFMADVWRTVNASLDLDRGGMIANGGDPDGIDFVASRILGKQAEATS